MEVRPSYVQHLREHPEIIGYGITVQELPWNNTIELHHVSSRSRYRIAMEAIYDSQFPYELLNDEARRFARNISEGRGATGSTPEYVRRMNGTTANFGELLDQQTRREFAREYTTAPNRFAEAANHVFAQWEKPELDLTRPPRSGKKIHRITSEAIARHPRASVKTWDNGWESLEVDGESYWIHRKDVNYAWIEVEGIPFGDTMINELQELTRVQRDAMMDEAIREAQVRHGQIGRITATTLINGWATNREQERMREHDQAVRDNQPRFYTMDEIEQARDEYVPVPREPNDEDEWADEYTPADEPAED